jgi:hypothetical protein
LFYDLEKGTVIAILNDDAPADGFAFSAAHDKLLAMGADGALRVYAPGSAEKLFTMRSAEPFTDFRFAADGSAAVGLTADGALVASLWTDEAALLAYAKTLAGR